MKTLMFAAAMAFAAALNLSSASAADLRNSSGAAAGVPHYEWQYHYAGHHPRYQGHWVLVK